MKLDVEFEESNQLIEIAFEEVQEVQGGQQIDLADYVKKTDCATNEHIDDRASEHPIAPDTIDYAVMSALTDSRLEWTDEQKQQAREILGVQEASGTGGTSGTGGSEYPKKVFEYEWKDNFDKINVTAIDFENGILTVDTMPRQITDDVSTTARLFPTLFIEGVVQHFKYGFIPQEILTRAENLYYAVKVGDSQIQLYSGTNAINLLTDSGNIDLTRWGFQVEKSRNQFMGNLDVANLESTHRYKAYFYIPYSASKTAGVRFNSPNGSFGKGYGNGYASTLIGVQKANTIYTTEFNQYETFSLRGIYYNFTYEYNYYPKIFEVDVRKVGNVYKADCTANYFYEIGTKNANTVFNMHTLHSNVFLQNPFSSIAFIGGNGNYIPDGSRCELWDYGEVF